MISAGLEGRIPYMTYPEPWRGPPKHPPEFLRPAPKPIPPSSRYNGVTTTTSPNGTRLAPSTQQHAQQQLRSITIAAKYPSPPAAVAVSSPAPVNLTQQQQQNHKDEIIEQSQSQSQPQPQELPTYSPYRLYHTPPAHHHFAPFPAYTALSMYHQSGPYAAHHLMRPTYHPPPPPTNPLPPPPPSPLDTYSPTTPTSTPTFLSPPLTNTFSPPSSTVTLTANKLIIGPGGIGIGHQQHNNLLREKRTPPQIQTSSVPPQPPHSAAAQLSPPQHQVAFKVPSGKEGSLKHRILTRPEDVIRNTPAPLDLQKLSSAPSSPAETPTRRRLNATISSPPRSPKKPLLNNNNNTTLPWNFSKGALIQLVNGELRKLEDMRTDDFVSSAELSTELRLAESTIVKIEENHSTGTANITLTYNHRRTQVECEASVEHPFFVYGQGWASCNPEKTQQTYGLKVHPLQVGDIIVSLTPRQPEQHSFVPPSSGFSVQQMSRPTTIMTTATSTAMTSRQIISTSSSSNGGSRTTNNHNRDSSLDQILLNHGSGIQVQPMNLHTSVGHISHAQSMSPESMAARRRRWSAPDQIFEEDDQTHTVAHKRHRGTE